MAVIGGTAFMVFDAGHLYSAPTLDGPFEPVARNHAFLSQEGYARFPRIFGSSYTGGGVSEDDDDDGDVGLVLITHHQMGKGAHQAS